MLLIGFELGGGYLGVFARFCDTFCDVLARAERRGQGNRKDKGEAGFCGIPPLPQEQGHGKDGAPGLKPIPFKELSFSVLILLDLCTG